jgi:hypothetical protein
VNDSVLPRILALKTLPVGDLKAMWRDLYQTEPQRFNRQFLDSRLAYRIQELAHGGLKPGTVKYLQQLGEQLDGGKAHVRRRRTDDRPLAGTRLIREWQGMAYEVLVEIDHFQYRGIRYKSLSAIAKLITGTSWNGPVFFGLKNARSPA